MKNKTRLAIIIILSAIIYTVAYFVIPFEHNNLAVYILVYIFTLLAFGVQFYTTRETFIKNNSVKSKIYGLPIARIGVIYLIVSLVLMLAVTITNAFVTVPLWIYVIIQLVVVALGTIGFLITDATKNEIKEQESKIKKHTKFMNELKIDIKVLADSFDYKPLNKSVNDLKDLIVYSDPVENEETVPLDKEIKQNYDLLKDAIINKNYELAAQEINKITNLVNTRNLKCKLNK